MTSKTMTRRGAILAAGAVAPMALLSSGAAQETIGQVPELDKLTDTQKYDYAKLGFAITMLVKAAESTMKPPKKHKDIIEIRLKKKLPDGTGDGCCIVTANIRRYDDKFIKVGAPDKTAGWVGEELKKFGLIDEFCVVC